MRSRCDLILCPYSNSDSDTPVVEWGVILYWNNILAKQHSVDSLSDLHFFIPTLKVFTALSARLLDEGCLYMADAILNYEL